LGEIVQVLEPFDPPSSLVFGDVATHPSDAKSQQIVGRIHRHQHFLHNNPNDPLTLDRLRGRSVPQTGKIFSELAELKKFRRGRNPRLRLLKSVVFLFEMTKRD
jgi:hypothetical protein